MEKIAARLDPSWIVLLHDRVEPTPFRPDERRRSGSIERRSSTSCAGTCGTVTCDPFWSARCCGGSTDQTGEVWRRVGDEAARLRDVLAESRARRSWPPSEVHHTVTPRPLDPPDADGGAVPKARDAVAEE